MAYYMNLLLHNDYAVRYTSDGSFSQTEAISGTLVFPYDAPTTVTSLCSWLAASSDPPSSMSTILVSNLIDALESTSACISAFPALIPRVLVPLGLTSVLEAITDELEDEYAEYPKFAIADCASLATAQEVVLQMDVRYIRASLGAQVDVLLPALDRFAYLCGIIEPEATAEQSLASDVPLRLLPAFNRCEYMCGIADSEDDPGVPPREVYQRLSQRFSMGSILADSATEGHPFYAMSFFRPYITGALRCANPSCTCTIYTLERAGEDLSFDPCAGCRAVHFCTAACQAGAAGHHAICSKIQAAGIRDLFDLRGYRACNLLGFASRTDVAWDCSPKS